MKGKLFSARKLFLAAKLHMSKHDALKILGVEPGAKKREVRKAYLAKVREFHPDMKGGDPEKFKKVQAAYELLHKNRFQTVIHEWKPKMRKYATPRRDHNFNRASGPRHSHFHGNFQEQRIPFSQIVTHMKNFVNDLILHMKSRKKSKQPMTDDEKLEKWISYVLNGTMAIPILCMLGILFIMKTRKKNPEQDHISISDERRPETFLVQLVTALNTIRQRHGYTFSNKQLFLCYSNHIIKGQRNIFLDDADLLYLESLFENASQVQELLELLEYVPDVLDELNSRTD